MSRIVSLMASATEIVDALGEFPSLVGRSHECDYPAEVARLPCCTRPRFDVSGNSREIDTLVKSTLANALSVYEVFDDVLERLQPTHIITQTQCEVCAVSLRDIENSVAARLASHPQIVSLQPDSLAGIWDDMRRVAQALGIQSRGERRIAELQRRMQEMSHRAQSAGASPTVACIEWLEPLMAAGNWTPELVGMAGGTNLFGEAGRHSPWMTWDDLLARDPDIIIAMPCGFDLARTAREMYWLTGNPRWPELRAAQTGRVYLADGNQYFNRPGPRVVESLEILVEMLWPDRFEPVWKEKGWRLGEERYNVPMRP
jgi:iron complex transport system substrate-binding protein